MPRPPLPGIAIAATLTLLLSACTASPTTTSSSASTATASAVSSAPASSSAASSAAASSPAATPSASASFSAAEIQFTTIAKSASPTLSALPDATVVALGEQVCSDFAAGKSEAQVATGLQQNAAKLDASAAVLVLAGAVSIICPKYRSKLK